MLAVVVIACGILAAAFAVRAVHRGRRGHPLAGLVHGLVAGVVLAVAAAAALVGVNLQGYMRLTNETPAAEVRFRQQGDRRFAAEVLYPDHTREAFDLAGDEWQLDARVLKWHAPATMLGLDTALRLDRIGGRYRDVANERSEPRTVYELAGARRRRVDARAALPHVAAVGRRPLRQRHLPADGRRRALRRQRRPDRPRRAAARPQGARGGVHLALTSARLLQKTRCRPLRAAQRPIGVILTGTVV